MWKAGVLLLTLLISDDKRVARQQVQLEKMKNMPTGRYGMAAATDGKWIYAIGGYDYNRGMTNRVHGYAMATEEWFRLRMPKKFTPKQYLRAVYIPELNGVLMAGGVMHSNDDHADEICRNPDIEVFDIETKRTYYLAHNENQAKLGGMAYQDGKLYLFGGSMDITNEQHRKPKIHYSSAFTSYDLKTKEWTILPNLPRAMETNGTIAGEYLYVFGGYNGEPHDDIYRYHLSEKTWEHIGEFETPLSAHAVVNYGKYILLAGDYTLHDRLIVFDTGSFEWTEYEANYAGRHMSAVVQGNTMYVMGGSNDNHGLNINRHVYQINLDKLINKK